MVPELGKVRIALPVSLSALTGYLASGIPWGMSTWYVLGGVFLLAMGASALNQAQEHHYDQKMERTRRRPIPSGRISPAGASLIAGVLILAGSLLLGMGCGRLSMLLGLMTIFWYNVLYTYLKRVTAFAVVPGSMVGALPPLIGWTASGSPVDDAALSLAAFFFIAQIPHFWLIVLSIGKQYEEAGYPSLSAILSPAQIGRLTLIWIAATASVGLFLRLTGDLDSPWLSAWLAAGAVWMCWGFLRMAGRSLDQVKPKEGFIRLNLFVLAVMLLIWIDAALT
ncbi:MAG TPA: protoheme IX farnesyltransferase [Bacteroidales bacterium]|nr:protoheme IX farnesyltransferase [Bacteroidales bacterium]